MNFENLTIGQLRKMKIDFEKMEIALEKYKIKYPKVEVKSAEEILEECKE